MNTRKLPPEILSAMFALAAVYIDELKTEEQLNDALCLFEANVPSKDPPQLSVPKFLTVKEVAENLGVTTRTVNSLLKSGCLQRTKIKRCTRISTESYLSYCKRVVEDDS